MDIRWIQRLDNYSKALKQFNSAVTAFEERELSDLEKQGLIKSFEFSYELSWNMLKDFLESRGNDSIYGSKDSFKEAFSYGLIENGDIWMSMIKSRNRTSHTYNVKTADEIISLIVKKYSPELNTLLDTMTTLAVKESENE